MTSWYENESFWSDTESVVFNEERRKKAPEEVEQILSLLGSPPGGALLDLGCGIGRHSLEFARTGHRVTGVDRTRRYLDAAGRTADEQKLDIEWVECDMREFRRPDAFDVAVSLLTSFGYFEDDADERRVVDNVFASLKPSGQFVLDIMPKEVLTRVFRERDWHEEPDGTMVLEERKVVDDWAWLDLRWIIVRDGRQREHRFRLRLYSAAELKTLLACAGFGVIRAFGSLVGSPYDQQAERLVIVAERP